MRFRRLTKYIFILLNSGAALAFGLVCLAPYLPPEQWWPVSLLALGFGFIVVTLIAFIFFWLVFRPRFILISLVPLLLGWKAISTFFAFSTPRRFNYEKKEGSLRVVHWNVGRFVEWKRNNNAGSKTRMKMMDLLKEQNADVLCLQEFFTSKDPEYYDNLGYVLRELGYPYHYFSWDNDGYLQWVGQAIFSRYPIVDSGMIRYPAPAMPESLLHADVAFGGDTLRLYTTHLQSVQFQADDFRRIRRIKETEGPIVEDSKSLFVKLKRGVVRRAIQARVVREVVAESPHPFLLTGDFNDVPNSYAYHTIRGKRLQDAFLQTGFGVGRTYTDIAPTLRIDYILATPEIRIRQFNRVIRNFNDHYLLVTDVELRK
jgi:endonuclease/exonuclease/phosphatase family metal-dependent hydrolase